MPEFRPFLMERMMSLYEQEAVNSSAFAERLRAEKSVLIVPGDHFGMDRYLRISYGLPHDYLVPALDRIHDLVVELQGL